MPIDVCAPSDPPNDGLIGDLLADIRRADQVESEAAVRRRNLEPQQIELARLLQQLPRQRPSRARRAAATTGSTSFCMNSAAVWPNMPLLFGEVLAHEHVVGGRRGEKLSAVDRGSASVS